jgi:hypothetical protein
MGTSPHAKTGNDRLPAMAGSGARATLSFRWNPFNWRRRMKRG